MSVVGAIMVPHPPIILPEVGRGEEKKIAASDSAYRKAAALAAELKPETIIVCSPHAVMYSDYFHISPGENARGDMGQFRAPQLRFLVRYDSAFTAELSELAEKEGFPAGTLGERSAALDHGTMIPLYYIDQLYTGFRLVRIGLSGLPLTDHYRLGQLIGQTAEKLGRRVLFVGSGDLSHKLLADGPYGFAPEGPAYDERIMDVMGRAAFDELFDFDESFCDRAAECGHRSFCMMAGALDGKRLETEKLSHEGTFGVGYGICTYRVTGDDPERRLLEKWRERRRQALDAQRQREDPWVKLARAEVEAWVREGRRIEPPGDLPAEMLSEQAGVFVSLHKEGQLRGCIGTIQATRRCVAEEIIENAISASTKDPRFSPVREDELDALEISVDVLARPEKIRSKDELDVKRYGVIVTKGWKRGLLLPNLDGVDSVDEQVSIALRKAGLSEREKDYELERFEVVRHV
ncbi:MAG: AmmeMemoRadiSam system protein A [Oscillospiraceae bacterium]|nr:AmmeMemoRadiSam system protein A [Oscillospiraceae bacterium]